MILISRQHWVKHGSSGRQLNLNRLPVFSLTGSIQAIRSVDDVESIWAVSFFTIKTLEQSKKEAVRQPEPIGLRLRAFPPLIVESRGQVNGQATYSLICDRIRLYISPAALVSFACPSTQRDCGSIDGGPRSNSTACFQPARMCVCKPRRFSHADDH